MGCCPALLRCRDSLRDGLNARIPVSLVQPGKTANAIKVFPRKQPLLLSHLGRLFMPKIPLPYLFNLIYLECVNRIWEIESMLEETKDWNVCWRVGWQLEWLLICPFALLDGFGHSQVISNDWAGSRPTKMDLKVIDVGSATLILFMCRRLAEMHEIRGRCSVGCDLEGRKPTRWISKQQVP